jgi:molybdenum cofactor cytidylyltransferase
MGSTLADAVAAHADWPGWIICLADMPAISAATYHAILTHTPTHGLLAPRWQGQRGHPVRIDQRYRQALCNLQGDTGARHLLAQHNDDLALLSVDDPGITLDIDTPSDLNRRLIL